MIKRKTADFNSFVAFDFETTGLGMHDKITEIGAVKVKDGYLVSRFSTLVDPGIPIDPMITKITGITNDMVAGKPAIEQLLPCFLDYTEGFPLVAHNAAFDCRFLEREAQVSGFFLDHEVFDTLQFARRVLPRMPSYKLTALSALLGIPQQDAHRAWCDAEACARLYMILRARAEKTACNAPLP